MAHIRRTDSFLCASVFSVERHPCYHNFFSTPFVSILMKSCGLSDYVCVLDLGMFELSLLTCDGSEKVKKEHNFSPIPLCNVLNVSHC